MILVPKKWDSRIREAELEKVPYILVVGDKEMQLNAVSVRERGGKDAGVMQLKEFIGKAQDKISNKTV